MCLCVCVCVCTCHQVRGYMYVYLYVSYQSHKSAFIGNMTMYCIYVCICIYTYARMCAFVHVCIHVFLYSFIMRSTHKFCGSLPQICVISAQKCGSHVCVYADVMSIYTNAYVIHVHVVDTCETKLSHRYMCTYLVCTWVHTYIHPYMWLQNCVNRAFMSQCTVMYTKNYTCMQICVFVCGCAYMCTSYMLGMRMCTWELG